jgi:putative endonuclease
MHFYYVYVLFSEKDKKLYIGFSSNVFLRFKQHQNGENISTANRRPLRLIYYEAHVNETDALRRESYFKSTHGKRTLQIILKEVLRELGYRSKN